MAVSIFIAQPEYCSGASARNKAKRARPAMKPAIFQGLSAFPITPADPDGQVDTDDLGAILARLTSAGVDSVGLLGSTGTYAYLSRAERARAIAAARACITDGTPLIVGAGALRTDAAVALAEDAARLGADGLLVAPVSYTPLTQDEAFSHFAAVAAATDLPLCIYNNPGTTHFTFSTDLLARLADLPTIKAVKMPLAPDLPADLARLRSVLPADFAIGYSGDWGCANALLAGADAWYSVIGGILPKASRRLAQAALSGDAAQTAVVDGQFKPVWDLFMTHGSLRVVYAIAHQLGLTRHSLPLPLRDLPADLHAAIAAAVAPLRD
jgi:4-hydroxy-tetrahydrodipicolinate synthase